MAAAVPVNYLHPPPRELLEGLDLRRIDDVFNDTGDRGGRLTEGSPVPIMCP
jgi:hypothetical protein